MNILETRKAIQKYGADNSYYQPSNPNLIDECSKAYYKSLNLPILNLIYNGDPYELIKCMISKEPGFIKRKKRTTGEMCYAINFEFNHICQKFKSGNVGTSIHKTTSPSDLIRGICITENLKYLDELIKCIPLSKREHGFITNDSQYGDIDLSNFENHEWPWVIRCRENYEFFLAVFDINDPILFPDYDTYMEQFYF